MSNLLLFSTQDALQRARKEWMVTKYDGLGRVVLTGVWNNGGVAMVRDTVQKRVNAETSPNLWEERASLRFQQFVLSAAALHRR